MTQSYCGATHSFAAQSRSSRTAVRISTSRKSLARPAARFMRMRSSREATHSSTPSTSTAVARHVAPNSPPCRQGGQGCPGRPHSREGEVIAHGQAPGVQLKGTSSGAPRRRAAGVAARPPALPGCGIARVADVEVDCYGRRPPQPARDATDDDESDSTIVECLEGARGIEALLAHFVRARRAAPRKPSRARASSAAAAIAHRREAKKLPDLCPIDAETCFHTTRQELHAASPK